MGIVEQASGKFTERDLELLADKLVEKSMRRVLETIGYDVSTPTERGEIREDHAWVRRWRKGSNTLGFTAGGAGITVIVGGILWIIWWGLKSALKVVPL